MQRAVVATSYDGLPPRQPLIKGDKQKDVSVAEEMEQEYETAKEQQTSVAKMKRGRKLTKIKEPVFHLHLYHDVAVASKLGELCNKYRIIEFVNIF